jgi:ATP-dependent Zn protease
VIGPAGQAASDLDALKARRVTNVTATGHDQRWVAFAAASSDSGFSDEEWQRYEPRMRRQTRRLVRKHRDEIERVAKALLHRKSLTPDEVDQLI